MGRKTFSKPPAYRRHATGQATVRIAGGAGRGLGLSSAEGRILCVLGGHWTVWRKELKIEDSAEVFVVRFDVWKGMG